MYKDPTEFRKRFAAWKDGKKPYEAELQEYEEGTKPINVGEYRVYPSAIGASELNVTTPDVVVTGTDRRPLYLRYDAYNSTYDPNTIRNFTDWLPIIGNAGLAVDFGDAVQNDDYTSAALLGGLVLLPPQLRKGLGIGGKVLKGLSKHAWYKFAKGQNWAARNVTNKIQNKFRETFSEGVQDIKNYMNSEEYLLRVREGIAVTQGSTKNVNQIANNLVDINNANLDNIQKLKIRSGDGTKNGSMQVRRFGFPHIMTLYRTARDPRATARHEAVHSTFNDTMRLFLSGLKMKPVIKNKYHAKLDELRARILNILADEYRTGNSTIGYSYDNLVDYVKRTGSQNGRELLKYFTKDQLNKTLPSMFGLTGMGYFLSQPEIEYTE